MKKIRVRYNEFEEYEQKLIILLELHFLIKKKCPKYIEVEILKLRKINQVSFIFLI